jgi:hypothetical protein
MVQDFWNVLCCIFIFSWSMDDALGGLVGAFTMKVEE